MSGFQSSRVRLLSHLGFSLLTYLAVAPPSFDGTYTIVNKKNGRRMFASANSGLFVVDDGGPIYTDQMWIFSPQDNGSFAIINAGNGLRVLAQSLADHEHGFFAIDNGPMYQDQKWHLIAQEDGSYTMVNVKSHRKIFANVSDSGKVIFAASQGNGSMLPEESWWLINQERDATSTFVAQLLNAENKLLEISKEVADVRFENQQLVQRLQSTLQQQQNVGAENEAAKLEVADALLNVEKERSANEQMAVELELHRSKHAHCEIKLLQQKQEKEALLTESMKAAEKAKSHQKELLKSALSKYKHATDILQDNITNLNADLAAAQELNEKLELTVDVLKGRLAQGMLYAWLFSNEICGTLFAIGIVAVLSCFGRCYWHVAANMRHKTQRICDLEDELRTELGGMLSVGDGDGGLTQEFGFSISDSEMNQETVRIINIQCPGVKHADVDVELVFNGCTVTICRQASRRLPSSMWTRTFQFKPSDGLFEFREEQMLLEDGILQLVFRANAFQSRRVLFARHFNLTETDADACWDFSAEAGQHSDDVDAWWHDGVDFSECDAERSKNRKATWQEASVDVDTESTASTVRDMV
mmetsp:Transcript_50097/g.79313  ORF Transcript_50097/g.79313 Transcript_50097/m.79313 type:complete len:587 (-) Transcript_50097:112-1872(-)